MSRPGSPNRRTKDETLCDALVAGMTVNDAATFSGVSPSTAFRRLRDPGFTRRLEEKRAERTARLNDRLESGAQRAVAVLIEECKAGRPADRIRAASALLTGVLSLRRLDLDTEHEAQGDPFTAWLMATSQKVEETP